MKIDAGRISGQVERGLAPVYLIAGDEPLLVDECCAPIRAKARADGFERSLHTVEAGFDWNALFAEIASPSLFAARTLHEIRIPNGKPGQAGAQALTRLAGSPARDTVLLVVTGKLDKDAQKSRWVEALEGAGVMAQVWPLDAARWPQWVAQRLASRGVAAKPGVAERLAHHMEGNLLAAAQEIDKLALLFGDRPVAPEDVEEGLSDNSRFTVYGWTDACLLGKPADVLHRLERLRAEGTEPFLLLWALTRELRTVAQMAFERGRGKPEAALMQAFHVWNQRKPMVTQALRRLPADRWFALLQEAARVERVIKGRAPGDPWHELEDLGLACCGVTAAA